MARPLPNKALLTGHFQRTLAHVGATSGRQLRTIWGDLGSYNESDIAEFTRKAHPVITAAKTVAVRHATAYYTLVAGVPAVAIAVDRITVRPDYREPFIATWLALKNGVNLNGAIEAGASRTDAVTRDLVVSTARQTGDVVVERAGLKVTHWERVPDGDACAWCLEVAPGFYLSAESADFGHSNCGCSAEPAFD